jgi:hypothetical protein
MSGPLTELFEPQAENSAKRLQLRQKKAQVWPFKAQFGSIFMAKIQFFYKV